jgi:pilus assembly protein CpaB
MKVARIDVLAVAAGGIAAVLAGRKEQTDSSPPLEPVAKLETTEFLVAKADIGIGQAVSAAEMQWQTTTTPPK